MQHIKRVSTKIVLVGLAVSVLSLWSYVDSPAAYGSTSVLTMTGFILPARCADTPGAYILDFKDQRFVFKLENLAVSYGDTGWARIDLLSGAPGPRTIRLVGDEDFTKLLKTNGSNCEGVRIGGYYYDSRKTLFVTSIGGAPKEGKCVKCS